MAKWITKNGVSVLFDNNFIEGMEEETPPLLVFEGEELKEINFNGYLIKKLKNKKEIGSYER